MVSSCPCCSRERDSFVCRSCLTKLLKLYKTQASSHQILLPAAQARAANGIRIADKTRQLEAKHWDVERRTSTIIHKISNLRQDNEAALQASRQRRHSIQGRQTRLAHAKARLRPSSSLPSAGLNFNPATATTGSHDVAEHLEEIASQLASTRQILVQELLDALDVVECSMLGCNYQIASLPVPSLPELHVLPKHQLNATLAILVLLVKHISIYLGIQLPFVLLGTATKPLIRALSGTMNALRYPKAYPLYMSSGPTYTSATSSISATTSAQALVSSAPTATPASHAQALVIGVRMLGFNANYIHKIASSDQASATQITPADAFEDLSRVDHFDILALLVDIGLARTTGWRAHVLSRKTDTLRKVETEADFAQFNRALEDKARTAPVLMGGTQDISIKNGKYVVVTSTLPAAKHLDTSDAGNAADNPDESWAMV